MHYPRIVVSSLLVLTVTGCGTPGSGSDKGSVGPSDAPGSGPSATAARKPGAQPTPTPTPSPSPTTAARPLGDLGPLDPADFSSTVDNGWYPLVVGSQWTYEGVKDRKRATDVFKVLATTEAVAGVTCVILQDDLALNGVPTERTTGYFAQHRDGSVWFFGEDIHELDAKGRVVGLDGSWRAGLDGATPGLMMPATPGVGDVFVQATAHAHFEVLSVAKAVKVPAGSYPAALLIEESDPEEPGLKARKYYVPQIGEVRDVSVGGPFEEMTLTAFRGP
jgi:hypothetical protein